MRGIISGISSVKLARSDSPKRNKYKCLGFYSGGPMDKKNYSKYDRNKAAIIIQREIRKYFGRMKLHLMKQKIQENNYIKKYTLSQ